MVGRFFVVCGIDGAGKTTLISSVANIMRNQGHTVELLKNPTKWFRSAPIVRDMLENGTREIRQEFFALFSAADRLLSLNKEIEPALEMGKHVIMDRYLLSSLAYVNARGNTDFPWLHEINKFVRKPDLGVYIDIDPSIALDRIIARDGVSKKSDEQDLNTLTKVRDNFRHLSKQDGYLIINGNNDSAQNAETVADHFLKRLSS